MSQQQFCQENVCYQQGIAFRPQKPYDLFHAFWSNELKNHTMKDDIKHMMVWDLRRQWGLAHQEPYQELFDLLEEKYTQDIGETLQILGEKEERVEKVEKGFNWTEPIMSDDCFVLILSFLDVWRTAGLRRVCSWWNQSIVHSEMLWYHILKGYTTVGSQSNDEKSLLLSSLPCDNTSLTTQQNVNSKIALMRESYLSPFEQFFALVERIPQVEFASILLKNEYIGMTSGRVLPTVFYSMMRLNCDNGSPDYIQHKLSVIMAIFNVNGYVPRLYHYFRVGYCSSASTIANTDAEINHTCIPLLSFCIAVMTDQERELYPVDETKESVDSNTGGRVVSVGIGVNTEGDFDPWIYYLHMEGRPIDLDNIFELCPEAKEVLNPENDDLSNAYEWFSDERGWANGVIFYNAGFTWFHQHRYFSLYNRTKKQMVVLKLQERVGTY